MLNWNLFEYELFYVKLGTVPIPGTQAAVVQACLPVQDGAEAFTTGACQPSKSNISLDYILYHLPHHLVAMTVSQN
jgi:hypothetical protein